MSSTGGEIGPTLTGGIQDAAAILPLGTEQYSEQVVSYAASTPMSNFGSLRMVISGFKTFNCLLLVRGYRRCKDTWECGIRAARRELFVEHGRGW